MAFRRRVLETTGPFDVLLGPGSITRALGGEEADLIFRASWCGFTGLYAPTPTVMHRHRRTTQVEVERVGHGYDLGNGGFYIKHILRKPTRLLVGRNWYSSVRAWKSTRILAYEVQGALIYLWHDRVLRRR